MNLLSKLSVITALFLIFNISFSIRAQGDSEMRPPADATHYSAIIKIDSEESVEALYEVGVEVLRRRGNLLLCFVPYSDPGKTVSRGNFEDDAGGGDHYSSYLRSVNGVVNIEPGRKVARSMDVARRWFDAYKLATGGEGRLPYRGNGVVTGICDIGIDPFHIGFLDNEGKTRIKRIVQYKEGTAERIVLDDEASFRRWQTDTFDEWHATHVANIMAGSAEPYTGMAPEADIVVTTSQLTDVGLLCGAEDILDYAKETGKRAVINMSMANYLGPHDGSSLFSQYIDMIGEEAVVVLSAGNAGNTNFTLPVTFSEDSSSVGLALYSSDWVQFTPYGAVDMWSLDDRRFEVRFGIQDGENKKIEWMYPWQSLTEGRSFRVTTDKDEVGYTSDNESIIYDSRLAELFSGWFSLRGGIDTENNRYRVLMEFDAKTEIESADGPWARYIPVVEVRGDAGVRVNIYADYQYTNFRSLPGGVSPGSLLSFSDLASGFNTISVGMFGNRNELPTISGEPDYAKYPAGTISPYSSYSCLDDGRVMPQTIAPGAVVISAISTPFLDKHPEQREQTNAMTSSGGNSYYWATNTGTSMSAPYVAGSIACWLEAAPELSPAEIREIVAATNRHDYPDPDNPRHGQGWFDALEGLKEAVKRHSGIDQISEDAPASGRLSFDGSALTLWNPSAAEMVVELFNTSAVMINSIECRERIQTIDLTGLIPGIYIARIKNSPTALKFIIK